MSRVQTSISQMVSFEDVTNIITQYFLEEVEGRDPVFGIILTRIFFPSAAQRERI